MKKAFDQNVSRAKPRVRLGTLTASEPTVEPEETPAPRHTARREQETPRNLADEVKSRAGRASVAKPSANEALRAAIARAAPAARTHEAPEAREQRYEQARDEMPRESAAVSRPGGEEAALSAMREEIFGARAFAEPPPGTWEVQNPPVHEDREVDRPSYARHDEPEVAYAEDSEFEEAAAVHVHEFVAHASSPHVVEARDFGPEFAPEEESEVSASSQVSVTTSATTSATTVETVEAAADTETRRERLRERLRAVRENPRPEPLPASVAEAGVRAVERISALQGELTRVKALNLALTQDLEGARRQAEKATEEARLRMDEARRLATDMEQRAKLLEELERELGSLEGERDEALLSLQESRQGLTAAADEKKALEENLVEKDRLLADTLQEEERLASELEVAKDEAQSLRRAMDTLHAERDTLARQVADLTQERAELLEARRALEAVHRALAQAASR